MLLYAADGRLRLKNLIESQCMSVPVNAPVPRFRVVVDSLVVQRLLAQARDTEEDQQIMCALQNGASSPLTQGLFGLSAKEVALRRAMLGLPNRKGR